MFKKIAEAYDVLSDPEKRKIYDMYGEQGLKGGVPPGGSQGFPFSGASAQGFHQRNPFGKGTGRYAFR